MSFKVAAKKENPLLDRAEISVEIIFTGAVPSRQELAKKIASHEGANENVVVIKSIETVHGYGRATVLAYIYKSEEAMKKIEYSYIFGRGKPKQAAGEQKAEAKA